jgi:hypothetical protein
MELLEMLIWGGGAPGTHWIEGWVDLRDSLDIMENRKISRLPVIEPRLSSP